MHTSFTTTNPEILRASVHLSRFRGANGVEELHLTVHPLEAGDIEAQSASLFAAYRDALASLDWDLNTAIFRRFFCDDLPVQAPVVREQGRQTARMLDSPCATSWVQQPPLPPAHVTLWAHHVRDPKGALAKAWDGNTLTLRRDGLLHHWTPGLCSPTHGSVHDQTRGLFTAYTELLADRGLTLADHVVRTWLYVRNIDSNYQGMVTARCDVFRRHQLTAETHYIASTGIEGAAEDPRVRVFMDAYAVSGLQSEQIQYLKALENLSPTHVYGVTFERATAVTYPDRTHITISGTASIDARGDILHPGDLSRQMDRTLENIGRLLREAGTGLDAMQVFTVYLRHDSDRAYAAWRMHEHFPDTPIIVVTGRVCRPGWLIEIEGEALFTPTREDENT